MPKQPKPAVTRIATTITARYYPTTGATDGFYLDGRLSGRREHRAADITLDREDRGFFYSVFARMSGGVPDDASTAQVRKHLDQIMTAVKQPGHNIDAEINDLAECAISVVGRIALKHDGMRQPYFGGILVRDSEMAAVTMGGGCAYLYRGDVLYPLTADDYPMEAIDYAGKPVQGLDVYCAGVAGTVRYSNIAQLQLDDCLIVCNKDVMEALGQRDVLRMLYEAEDQADAAGMIMTAAAAKLPGTPMQFMIGFVENIASVDRTARLGLTRNHGETAASLGGFAAAATPRTEPLLPRSKQRTNDWSAPEEPAVDDESMPDLMYSQPKASSAYAPPRYEPIEPIEDEPGDEDLFGDEIDTYGRGRRIAFYVIIAAICIACIILIYNMLFKGDDTQQTTTSSTTTETTENTGQTTTEPTGTTTTGSETTTGTTTTESSQPSGEVLARHTVVSGDTPWGIAVKYYGTGPTEYMQLILDANDIDYDIVDGEIKNAVIKVGDVLDIPVLPD